MGEQLIVDGGDVLAVRRNGAFLRSRLPFLSIDLDGPVQRRLPEADAMVITLPPGRQSARDPALSHLAQLRHLDAALRSTPRRVVFVSSTGVFDEPTDHRALTEADGPSPVTERGRMLRDRELLASDLFGAHIVRPAGIYGPGREMLIRKVLEGTPVQYAKRTNRIHETDLVRTLRRVLSMEDPPDIVHAVDQAPAPLGDVVTFIAGRLGLQAPPRIHPETSSGKVLSGTLLMTLLSSLHHPTYESGYGELIATRRNDQETS